jgi:hypothetical protein
MIKELKKNPLIKIKELEVGEPVNDIAIEMIESGFDIKFPDFLKELLRHHNGLRLTWVADENHSWKRIDAHDNFTPYGKFWLPDIDTMFLGPQTSNWETYIWNEEMEKEELDELQNLVPVDYFDNNRSECICMKKAGSHLKTNPLYYHSIDSGLLQFSASLEKYMEYSAKLYAFAYWQQALMAPEGQMRSYFDNYFPQLFPSEKIEFPKFD